MAGVSGSSWPIPFVVPPCTQSAILRNRHKVPRCSLIGWPCLACFSGSLVRRISSVISPPIALGGYRPWRCQVAEKGPRNGAKRGEYLRKHGRRKARQPPPCIHRSRRDQALALL